ncbi:hypothetical protein [Methanofollis ethanolicus]|uniref:hypothetical protein n=1 Tax=Methanofollis ethanolicus TaxID=488124 RepID=UPI00128ECF78|nr:hypothetical protein [Methanofollis ethanolicus]
MQTLNDGAILTGRVNVASAYLDRPFKLYNGTWGSAICTVSQPTGTIEVRAGTALGTDVDPKKTDTRTPAVIPATMNVQFKLDTTNLNNGNFVNPWYEYELRTPGGVPISTVTNMAGNTVSLAGLTGDPSDDNNILAFSIADQNPNPEEGTYVMTFTAYNGNDAFYTKDYRFDVVRYTLAASASPSVVNADQTTTLTITGKPYTYYTIVIEDTMDGKPELPATGNYDIYVSKYNATVHPDWSGTVRVPLYIPATGGDSSHTTRSYYPKIYETRNPSTFTTVQVMVEPGGSTKEIVLDASKLSNDEYYCLGDTIPVTGRLGAAAADEMDVYFYITGPNLDSNGVKPSNPQIGAIDGDNSTFESVHISKGQTEFEYRWNTGNTGLTDGTYTIFATVNPTGYASRALIETDVKDYREVDLNQPSINVMFPQEAPGFFAQGDHIVSLWTARGSPAKSSYTGKIRYYIFGSNLRYTGIQEFPLPKVDKDATPEQLNALADKGDYPGYSGLNLPRSFSANLSRGEYTVVYQHPMNDQTFNVRPIQGDTYSGDLTTLIISSGESVDISALQSADAVSALKNAIASSLVDDSLVTQTFTVEKSVVDVGPIQDYEVGEAIPITGTTNLECTVYYPYNQIDLPGDSVSLALYTADMYYAGKTQSTNRIYSASAVPAKTATGAASRKVSFTIPAERSAQMTAGDYVAVIKCEDIKYKKEILFTLHEEGYRKEHGLASPVTGEEFNSNPVTPANPVWVTPTATMYVPTPSATATTPSSGQAMGYETIFSVFSALAIFCTLLYAARR